MNLKLLSITIAVVLVLLSAIAVLKGQLEQVKVERDQAVKFTLSKDDTIQHLQTKLGHASAKTYVQDLTIQNLRRFREDDRIAWVNDIKGIKKDLRNIQQISSTTAHMTSLFHIPLTDTTIIHGRWTSGTIVSNDSVYSTVKKFDNKNTWIHIKGIVTADTAVITANVFVPLKSVVYWERKKFLGIARMWPAKKEWFKQTTSDNPYVTITKDELIRVTKKKQK